MKKLKGKHHPYCRATYKKYLAHTLRLEWSCICDILNNYEKWKVSDQFIQFTDRLIATLKAERKP